MLCTLLLFLCPFLWTKAFTPRRHVLHAKRAAWFLKVVLSCQLLLFIQVWSNSGEKSLPLVASRLFCTTCGSQCERAVCTYHIWHVLSLERSDWPFRKCCGLVFWAADSFRFPSPSNTHSPIPLPGLLQHPTQTDTWFLSFLIPFPLLGGIFPSIQLLSQSDLFYTAEL